MIPHQQFSLCTDTCAWQSCERAFCLVDSRDRICSTPHDSPLQAMLVACQLPFCSIPRTTACPWPRRRRRPPRPVLRHTRPCCQSAVYRSSAQWQSAEAGGNVSSSFSNAVVGRKEAVGNGVYCTRCGRHQRSPAAAFLFAPFVPDRPSQKLGIILINLPRCDFGWRSWQSQMAGRPRSRLRKVQRAGALRAVG